MRALHSRWRALGVLFLLASLAPGGRPASAAPADPGALAVSVTLEPVEIRVGDVAQLTVIVDHPGAGSLELPALDRGKAVVVRERRRESAAPAGDQAGGRERTTFKIRLTSFEPGEHRVGPGKITFAGRGGGPLEIPFPDTALRCRSLLPGADTPLRGIKGLARWPSPLPRRAALAAGLLLLAAAIFLGVRRKLARRRAAPPAAGSRPALPHEAALKALAALKGRKLVEQGQVERFYQELSAIVRRYIEDRFGLRSPEQTTEEFIAAAAGFGLLQTVHQELVRAFLEQCDLVKFARHRPLPDDAARAFAAAERLVGETKQPAAHAPAPRPGVKRPTHGVVAAP